MTRPPGCDISVRRPLAGQTVASVVVYNRGAPRPCRGQRSSQESECQQSIKLYVNSVFVRPDRARAGRHRPRAAASRSRATPVPAAQPLPAAHSLLPAPLPACVRAPHQHTASQSVASAPSQVSHVYLSAVARASVYLQPVLL